MKTKRCIQCNKIFFRRYGKRGNESNDGWEKRKFCSHKCFYESNRRTTICEYCGKEFTRNKGYSRRKVRFCSVICSNQWKTENKLTGFYKEHPKYNIDYSHRKPLTKEQKENHSKSAKNSPKVLKHLRNLAKKHRGKNHWNWKGGISRKNHRRETKEYKEWRMRIYQKDNFTCWICEGKQKHPVAHHLLSWKDYPELRFKTGNGLTLCRFCHKVYAKQ